MTWLLSQPVAAFWAYPVPAPNEENEKINSWQYQVPFQLHSGEAAQSPTEKAPARSAPEVSGTVGVSTGEGF